MEPSSDSSIVALEYSTGFVEQSGSLDGQTISLKVSGSNHQDYGTERPDSSSGMCRIIRGIIRTAEMPENAQIGKIFPPLAKNFGFPEKSGEKKSPDFRRNQAIQIGSGGWI